MDQALLIQFLKSFFALFKASIEEHKIIDQKIFGTIGWPNENDKQNFSWSIETDSSILSNTKLLCDYLGYNNLIDGDCIIISEKILLSQLIESEWEEAEAQKTIDYLCKFEVRMLDDGTETDSFFIHF